MSNNIYSHQNNHNIVRDYEKLQGVTHPTDLSYQIIRDINSRYITVENSAARPMGIAITDYLSGPTPQILFTLGPGEIKHLGINSQGGPPQYIWILSVQTGLPIGAPTCLRRDVNQFVVRDGLNKAFIHFFKRPSYSAAR